MTILGADSIIVLKRFTWIELPPKNLKIRSNINRDSGSKRTFHHTELNILCLNYAICKPNEYKTLLVSGDTLQN